MGTLVITSRTFDVDGNETSTVTLTAEVDDLPVDTPEPADYTQTFQYHGMERVVQNPVIDSERRLLSGFELTRDGLKTDQFKHYKLNEIGNRSFPRAYYY